MTTNSHHLPALTGFVWLFQLHSYAVESNIQHIELDVFAMIENMDSLPLAVNEAKYDLYLGCSCFFLLKLQLIKAIMTNTTDLCADDFGL